MSKKSSFAEKIAPTLTNTTVVAAPAIDPSTKITMTFAELQVLLAGSQIAPVAKPVSPRKTPAVVATAPTAKPEKEPRGIGFFSTGKICMLTCQDGVQGATPTVSPGDAATFSVAFPERATMKDGKAVKLAAEVRAYTVKEWKRNSKNTGWVAYFPKKVV